MKPVEVAVIGTGWFGGIRAETLSRSALVDKLHICEIRPDRLAEVKALTNPATATLDYQDIIRNPDISVVYISTTPESNHYPIARDCLKAGKHVLLEKPIALELWEADELIALATRGNAEVHDRLFAALQSEIRIRQEEDRRRHPWQRGVNVMVSRHISRGLGKKIARARKTIARGMESTHDLDFVFWLLEPAKPVRDLFARVLTASCKASTARIDCMWTTVNMDNGALVVIGGGWNLPPSYPNFCSTWIEITGTEGALILDDTHRDNWLRHDAATVPNPDVDHAGRTGGPRVRRPDGPGDHPLSGIHPARPTRHGCAGARPHGDGDIPGRGPFGRDNEPIDFPLSNSADFGDSTT